MGVVIVISAFLWKRKFAKIALLFLIAFQVIICFKFVNYSFISNYIMTRNSTDVPPETASKNALGTLNLHLWFGTCAKDTNALCSFPMFPKAPDKRVFPFPEHPKLRDQKNWIYPLGEEEAFQVVDTFMESLEKKPGKLGLKKVRSVERKTDEKKGNRYLIEAELWDFTNNKTVMLSEYVFMPNDTRKLCYPKNLQWNKTTPVYLVVTSKNLGRWLHHFIKNVEKIFLETNDPYLHVIIFDYNSTDINLENVLQQSSLKNYMLLRESGDYSRTRSFTKAINLVSDPQSIIFMVDLHLDIASPLINNIRKHCIEGRMVYTPIVVEMECGANPANLAGVWQVYGYGIIGMYKSDWDRAGGFPVDKNTWGGEDWALVDGLFGLGMEFERMRTTHVYHYYHSKKGLW